jgi:hypothetical protein
MDLSAVLTPSATLYPLTLYTLDIAPEPTLVATPKLAEWATPANVLVSSNVGLEVPTALATARAAATPPAPALALPALDATAWAKL